MKKIKVFETTTGLGDSPINEFLSRPGITLLEVHTAAAAPEGHIFHYVTIVYEEGEGA